MSATGVAGERQRRRIFGVEPQRETALFRGKAAGPANRPQWHSLAVDDQVEITRKTRCEARDIGVAFGLGGNSITVGVSSMKLSQRRQLPEHYDVMHFHHVVCEL